MSPEYARQKYAEYRARRIRFRVFAALTAVMVVAVGFLTFKYSEQESRLDQISSFAAQEASARSGMTSQLQTADAKAYLEKIDTGTPEWKSILDERDSARVTARQNIIDKFAQDIWFPDLRERLNQVADKSYGTRSEVEDGLKGHAVSLMVHACYAMDKDSKLGIDGALKQYDESQAAFYKDVKQSDQQIQSGKFFRSLLSDSLNKGCPPASTITVLPDPMALASPQVPK